MALAAEAGDNIERTYNVENDGKAQHNDYRTIEYPGQYGIQSFFEGFVIGFFFLLYRL
jgi:hypothetical protein